jgi:hypothetical protein
MIFYISVLPHPCPLPLGEGELSPDGLKYQGRNWPFAPSQFIKSNKGMSSPGGEETGEGELKCGRKPAVIKLMSRCGPNSSLKIHHSKLPKTPVIKVQLSLIKVNKAYLSIFRPPSPLPPFYLTKNRQIIDLYGFTILTHVKKVRVLYEKKRVQIRDKKQKLESIFSVLVRCSSAIFSYVLVQIQY